MTIKSLAVGVVAIGMVALAATSASAANLITNGNFTNGSDGLTGWTLTGNPTGDHQDTAVIDYTTGDPFPSGAFGEAVPQQSEPSPTAVYFVTDVPVNVSLTQDYTTNSAGNYTISFDYYTPGNGRANPLDGNLVVSNDDAVLTDIDIKHTNSGLGWYTFSTTTFLAGGNNTLTFLFSVDGNVPGTPTQTAADILVTNVAVTGGVPEPATWGMLLVGFFGLGAFVRHRSHVQIA